jgi:hypothetical protein
VEATGPFTKEGCTRGARIASDLSCVGVAGDFELQQPKAAARSGPQKADAVRENWRSPFRPPRTTSDVFVNSSRPLKRA